MEVVGVDIARVRGLYPALATSTAQLDGAFAALSPESVIRAIITTLRAGPAQPGSRSTRSQETATRLLRARRAAADLVKGQAEDVVLGENTASMLLRFSALLSSDWQLGDEIVLSRLDADVAMRPWLRVARSRGVVVRWAEVDLETGEVPAWQYADLVGQRTRIVTVSLANAATGTVPDVRAIADFAHAHGALVVVDAGVAPVYVPLDLAELGADLLAVSGPTFGGPTVAAMIARPGLLDEVSGGRFGPDVAVSQRFEVSPLPVELLDGFTAAVDHLADLDEYAKGPRRERLVTSVTAAARYARHLYDRLDAGLRALPKVTVLGAADRQLPVAAFTVAGRTPDEVGTHLQRRNISVWTGPSGMSELLRVFGADELGGAVFVGVMPHTTAGEIDQFLTALTPLARQLTG